MNSLIWKIGMGTAALCLLFLVIGTLLPTKRHLECSITISAPARVIFTEVNSFKQWPHWATWPTDIDPKAIAMLKYKGPEAGVGSTMIWDNKAMLEKNRKAGKGSQKIVVSVPYKRILIDLQFDGFKGTVTTNWKFEEYQPEETHVTCSNYIHNKNGIFSRYLDIIKWSQVGKNCKENIKDLKAYVESLYKNQKCVQEI